MPKLPISASLRLSKLATNRDRLNVASPDLCSRKATSRVSPESLTSDTSNRASVDPRAPRSSLIPGKMSVNQDEFKDSLTESLSSLTNRKFERNLDTQDDDDIPNFMPLWLSPVLPKPSSPFSTRLEELLNDCFYAAVDRSVLSAERLTVVTDFHKYLHEIHCHENLAFIIEIFKYEYFYEKIYGARDGKDSTSGLGRIRSLNSDFLNSSLKQYIDNLPYPTSSMRKVVRRNSLRSRSSQSINTPEPFPLDFDEPVMEANEIWNNFCDSNISSESEDDSLLEMVSTNSQESSSDRLLKEQWEYIINTFIVPNLPSQINLSDKTVDYLLNVQSMTDRVHNPLVLQRVKSEVVLILRENALDSFIRKENLQEGNIFDKLYSSSVPALTIASPINNSRTHSQASSASDTPNTKGQLQKNRGAPRSVDGSTDHADPAVVAPVPSKRRTKIFSAFSNSNSSEGLSSPSGSFTSLLTLFKNPALGGYGRMANPAPQSPSPSSARSRAVTPSSLLDISENAPITNPTQLDGQQNPSILGKLWRKKK